MSKILQGLLVNGCIVFYCMGYTMLFTESPVHEHLRFQLFSIINKVAKNILQLLWSTFMMISCRYSPSREIAHSIKGF